MAFSRGQFKSTSNRDRRPTTRVGAIDVHMLVNGEYPEAWLDAIARLLAERMNAERKEGVPKVRVVRESAEDGGDSDSGAG